MNEAVMREVVGDHSVNEVLTVGRGRSRWTRRTSCSSSATGTNRPRGAPDRPAGRESTRPGQAAFNEVNQAIQEKERLINEAGRLQPDRPQRPRRSERVVRAAEGYALERINNARGDVARFVNIYDEYRKAPT